VGDAGVVAEAAVDGLFVGEFEAGTVVVEVYVMVLVRVWAVERADFGDFEGVGGMVEYYGCLSDGENCSGVALEDGSIGVHEGCCSVRIDLGVHV